MDIVQKNCPYSKYDHPLQISVTLSDLHVYTTGLIGYCAIRPGNFTIVLDKNFWKNETEDNKFESITHEMTHCLFDLGHSSDPFNYMFPSLGSTNMQFKQETIQQFMNVVNKQCH